MPKHHHNRQTDNLKLGLLIAGLLAVVYLVMRLAGVGPEM